MEASLSLLVRVLLGAIFILAGGRKLRSPDTFETSLTHVTALPAPIRRLLATVLAPAEIFLGLCLVLGVMVQPAAVAALCLLIAFTVTSLLLPKLRQECGCFAGLPFIDSGGRHSMIARNGLLVGLAVVVSINSPSPSFAPGLPTAAAIAAVISGTLIAIALRMRFQARPAAVSSPDATPELSRRRFLLGVTRVAAAVSLGGILAHQRLLTRVEASCYGCGSCASEMVWAYCSTPCCAYFWVRRREYCAPNCFPCSGWQLEQHCGVSACC